MKNLSEADVKGKRVLVRADFNVSLGQNNSVMDDFRIRATAPTLEFLVERGAKIILMSHLGKPDGRTDEKFRLDPVAKNLVEHLGRPVAKASDCLGEGVQAMAADLKNGEILLLENLRFHREEEANDEKFAQALAALGDLYVNDAFGVSHRAHASVCAITKFLPSYAGLLLRTEIDNLSRARDNPDHPLTVVIGGAKISTKIKLIQSFFKKAENIILGGALANTVLLAKGIAVGKSLIEEAMIPEVQRFEITDTKIHLPVDALLCTDKNDPRTCRLGPIGLARPEEWIIDIGEDTKKLFARVIKDSKMIIWNGPVGIFEKEEFAKGSLAVAQAIADSGAYSVVGGGETVAFLERAGLIQKFSFVSTGGGAMLEFLSGEKMPGLEALG